MKKIIVLLLIMALQHTVADAQIRYVPGSFLHTNASDVVAGGKNIGSKNMSSALTDYAPSHDDDQIKSGIVRVSFKNLANEDVENHVQASVSPGFVNRSEYVRNASGSIEYWVHVDPEDNVIMTLQVDGLGAVRIPNLKIGSGKMYALEIESAEMESVTFSSNVDGTEVWFDGKPLGGKTAKGMNITKDKTTMGTHKVKAVAGNLVKEFDIEVTKTNSHFPLDMLERHTVNFSSNEPGVVLYEGTVALGTMPVAIEVTEGPHSFIVKKPGYDDVAYNVNITDSEPRVFNIHKSKTIDFYAIGNTYNFHGAAVYIDNEYKGDTPLQLSLPYGKYNVRMAYSGREKGSKLTVNDETSSKFTLKLPAQHRRFDPFNIDYKKREIGLSFAYVQKWMHISDGRYSIGINYFAEEKHMSGFQIGIPVQPIFGYGLGLNTGIFYEAYFASFTDYDKTDMVEHNLYMPIDLMFRLPLGENFSIFVTGGLGIDWSIQTVLSSEGYDDYNIDYSEDGAPNHFNFSGEFGGGIQFKALQLSGNYQIGLNNNANMVTEDLTSKLRKFSIQLSILF